MVIGCRVRFAIEFSEGGLGVTNRRVTLRFVPLDDIQVAAHHVRLQVLLVHVLLLQLLGHEDVFLSLLARLRITQKADYLLLALEDQLLRVGFVGLAHQVLECRQLRGTGLLVLQKPHVAHSDSFEIKKINFK